MSHETPPLRACQDSNLLTEELKAAQALLQEKESKVVLLEETLNDVKGKVRSYVLDNLTHSQVLHLIRIIRAGSRTGPDSVQAGKCGRGAAQCHQQVQGGGVLFGQDNVRGMGVTLQSPQIPMADSSPCRSDLRVTETELRGARAQLQQAFDQLASTKGKLDDTQVRRVRMMP